jgi:hypothetical protein
MYSLSDHYLFSEKLIYDVDNLQVGREVTQCDITPIYMLILVLISYFILTEICRTILYKVRKYIEDKKSIKKNKKITYDPLT